MVYIPGIDGTGLAAFRQFPVLVEAFELISMSVPPGDRTDFTGLVEVVEVIDRGFPSYVAQAVDVTFWFRGHLDAHGNTKKSPISFCF